MLSPQKSELPINTYTQSLQPLQSSSDCLHRDCSAAFHPEDALEAKVSTAEAPRAGRRVPRRASERSG